MKISLQAFADLIVGINILTGFSLNLFSVDNHLCARVSIRQQSSFLYCDSGLSERHAAVGRFLVLKRSGHFQKSFASGDVRVDDGFARARIDEPRIHKKFFSGK